MGLPNRIISPGLLGGKHDDDWLRSRQAEAIALLLATQTQLDGLARQPGPAQQAYFSYNGRSDKWYDSRTLNRGTRRVPCGHRLPPQRVGK